MPGLTVLLAFTSAAALAEPVHEAPAVSSTTIVSSPAKGDTYELGEIIEVAVEFDIAVTATGSPQMALTIGSHTRKATFSRLDGQSLYFAYDVHEDDLDQDGISIAANALILDGGTITADDGTVDADLAHAAVAAKGASKVNGSLFSPPAVKSISFRSSPARDDTYELGETIEVVVEFDRVVTATGETQVALTVGTETRHATAFGWGSRPFLHFSYTVQEADRDVDGISIPANALSLDRGTIKGPDGATDADLTHAAVAADDGSRVNGSLASPPAVTSIFFASSPSSGDTYERGEKIEVLVRFDRMVTATGTARMALTIGEETRQATSPGSSWGSSLGLFLDYTVQEGDRDEDGISFPANALSVDGGTIKGPDDTTDADLTHVAKAADAGRKVDGSLASPPAVKRIYFMSSRASDDTYELGETVEVLVEFDKAVTVAGSPQLALTIGAETRHAAYSNSWDGRSALFSYTVQEGDRDEDGVSIPANALSRGGGTITADDGSTDADLTHEEVAPERDKKVDGSSDVPPPRVRGISIESAPAHGETYQLGETIEIEVEFDRAVKTTREPRLALTIGTQTRHATGHAWGHFVSFRYTVQAGDRDEDGISIPANALSLNGGSITAADGTTDAILTHEAMALDGASRVNGSDVTPPRVRAIRFGYSPPARGDTYELGETVEVEVEFDRAVTATGDPQVALSIGTETRQAAFGGWGAQTLYFEYTVQTGDRDQDGISIPANALSLNGGTITATDGATDADLTHPAVGPERDRKVDGSSDVRPPRVTHISFDSSPTGGDTYELGETIELVVDFDGAVKVTGSPRLALTIGAETRNATWFGWGSSFLLFQYTVQAGDRDKDGISIPANALSRGGGTITAADGITNADLTHAAVAAELGSKVDGSLISPPVVTNVHFISSPARGDTYERGEMVEVLVEFDKEVTMTGSPQVALAIGAETRHAISPEEGWGAALYFHYTVQAGDHDEDGISIAANALLLNGGAITAADGTTDADLTHGAVTAWHGGKVNGSLISPPGVKDVYFIFSPTRDDTYERGQKIEVLVEFDKAVTVTGSPQVAMIIGTQTRQADYAASWDDRHALFRYAVQESDVDDDGIDIPANALTFNGGTITTADGTTDADLTHDAVAAHAPLKVNGSLVTSPAVRAIYLDNHVPPPSGDTYVRGERIRVWVEFDRDVMVTGSPQVALTIGSQTRLATYSGPSTVVAPGWGTLVDEDVLSFDYLVQAADHDEDGISIPANALALNGGTIRLAAEPTIDADVAHDAVPPDPARKVSGSRATPRTSTLFEADHERTIAIT